VFWFFDAPEQPILSIGRVSFDVALGDEPFDSFDLHCYVDMRCPTGVGDGFDGAEIILTLGVGEEAAKPLEIGVSFFDVRVFGMDVGGIAIYLPNFHQSISDRIALDVSDGATQVCDLTDSWS